MKEQTSHTNHILITPNHLKGNVRKDFGPYNIDRNDGKVKLFAAF